MSHTPGPWKLGRHFSEIITDNEVNTDRPKYPWATDELESYGGYLVAESVFNKENAQLISAAPDMLEALIEVLKFHDDQIHALDVWEKARNAISKAKGEKVHE